MACPRLAFSLPHLEFRVSVKMSKPYGENVLGKYVKHTRVYNGTQSERRGEIYEVKTTLTAHKTLVRRHHVNFDGLFEWLDLAVEEENGNLTWAENDNSERFSVDGCLVNETRQAPAIKIEQPEDSALESEVSSMPETRQAPTVKIERCEDSRPNVAVTPQEINKPKRFSKKKKISSKVVMPWTSNGGGSRKSGSATETKISKTQPKEIVPDKISEQDREAEKEESTNYEQLRSPKKKHRSSIPNNPTVSPDSPNPDVPVSNAPACRLAKQKPKKKQIGQATKDARAKAKATHQVRPSPVETEAMRSGASELVDGLRPKPPQEATGDWPQNWLEGLRKFMRTVPHGPKKRVVTESNAKNCLRQVKLLSSGEGVTYHHWPDRVRFYFGKRVDLSFDLEQMLQEAKDYEKKYGKDKGNGWLLKHPIKKMHYYKLYLRKKKRLNVASQSKVAR